MSLAEQFRHITFHDLLDAIQIYLEKNDHGYISHIELVGKDEVKFLIMYSVQSGSDSIELSVKIGNWDNGFFQLRFEGLNAMEWKDVSIRLKHYQPYFKPKYGFDRSYRLNDKIELPVMCGHHDTILKYFWDLIIGTTKIFAEV